MPHVALNLLYWYYPLLLGSLELNQALIPA